MPVAPPRACPRCKRAFTGRRCPCSESEFVKVHHPKIEENRPTAAQRGYSAAWRKAREGFLRKHPLCVVCEGRGKLTPATVVDHIRPHRGDKDLFWDSANWQPLCKRCHDRKTGRGL